MKPLNIEDLLDKQDFQAWEEIHDGMSFKGSWHFYFFFEREDREELSQVYRLSSTIAHIAWDEV